MPLEIDSGKLRGFLLAVTRCASDDETRGALLHVEVSADLSNWCATDGHRLTEVRIGRASKDACLSEKERNATLYRAKDLERIAKLLPKGKASKPCTVFRASPGALLTFALPNASHMAECVTDYQFPDVARVITPRGVAPEGLNDTRENAPLAFQGVSVAGFNAEYLSDLGELAKDFYGDAFKSRSTKGVRLTFPTDAHSPLRADVDYPSEDKVPPCSLVHVLMAVRL